MLEGVSAPFLRWLYQHALCLAFPSLYEGFGLPVLEAMASGCPVIAAPTGSLPEVGGEAAVYVDPLSPGSIGLAIRDLAGSAERRAAAADRGPAAGRALELRADGGRDARRVRGGGTSRMRVGIDASLASRHGTGTGRYAALLVQHLVARDRDSDYVLYFRRRDRGANPLLSLASPRVQRRVTDAPLTLLRLHLNLSLRLRRDAVDVYHSLGFFVPWLWRGKSVVTIHDIHPVLLPHHWWRPGARTSYLALRLHIPISLRQARWIIAPSQYVKDTIRQRFRIAPEKILVAPHGADPFFLAAPSPAEVEAVERRWGARPFFLYVGELAPHKNPQGAIQALARLRERCPAQDARLIAGGPAAGRYEERELVPLIHRLGLSRDVVLERLPR